MVTHKVLALVFALLFTGPSAFSREYLVQFKNLPEHRQGLMALSEELEGATVELSIPEHDIALVETATSSLAENEVVARLKARADIEHVQKNFRYRTMLYLGGKPDVRPAPEPSNGPDPLLKSDRDLALVNAPEAWKVERGSRKVVVAVLDTGVDYNHEDLVNNMWHDPSDPKIVGWDFIDNDSKPFDVTKGINFLTGAGNPGHGTHCAGNVGAVGANSVGTSGIAPNVSIMAMRMLDEEGSGETEAAVKAIDWAVKRGAHIISASWGSEGASEDDKILKDAIERARAKGVLFIAAAGNTQPKDQKSADNDNNPKRRTFPASFDLDNIISVAASNWQGKMADFTHFGAKTVHLAAPGAQSFSTIPSDRSAEDYPGSSKYEDSFEIAILGKMPWNGTSMAAPQVAGAAALVLSQNPDWSYAQVKKRLLDSARPEPTFSGKSVTGGVLDVSAALR